MGLLRKRKTINPDLLREINKLDLPDKEISLIKGKIYEIWKAGISDADLKIKIAVQKIATVPDFKAEFLEAPVRCVMNIRVTEHTPVEEQTKTTEHH